MRVSEDVGSYWWVLIKPRLYLFNGNPTSVEENFVRPLRLLSAFLKITAPFSHSSTIIYAKSRKVPRCETNPEPETLNPKP